MNKQCSFIIDTLYNNGFKGFLVGGCVRDMLLKKEPQDYDITTNALPHEIKSLFPKSILTGEKYGTVTVLVDDFRAEVTTFRTESEYVNNRKPSKVNFATSLYDDLKRRDFTINAMCFNEKEGLIDFHNGKNDLEKKIIRTVGDPNQRFREDALRMLRAVRFSTKLDFEIHKDTFLGIKKNVHLLLNISRERILSELSLMFEINPKISVELMIELDMFKYISDLLVVDGNIGKMLKGVYGFENAMAIILHNNLAAHEVLNSLKLSNLQKKRVLNTIYLINSPIAPTKKDIKKMLYDLNSPDYFLDILKLKNNSKLIDIYNEIISNKECCSLKELSLKGDELINLGVKKELIGEVLNSALLKVILGEISNQ